MEAENAETIIRPLKAIDDADASGGKAIDNSRIPSHVVKAYISFSPAINYSGKYKFWARCMWKNECANTFYLKINQDRRIKFGEEPVFNKWFWVTTWKTFDLKHGMNHIAIWNEEADTKIDKILLTTDAYFKPQGKGETCDYQVNFSDNNIPFKLEKRKLWKIVTDTVCNSHVFYLEPFSGEDMVSAILPVKASFKNFLFDANIRFSNDACFMFNMEKNNFYLLRLYPDRSELIRSKDGAETRISSAINGIDQNTYSRYAVLRYFPEILVLKDGKVIHRVTDNSLAYGNVGIGSTTGNIFLQDVNYKTDLDPVYNCTFWFHDLHKWPWGSDGDWRIERENIQYVKGRASGGSEDAFYFIWKDYFRDYAVTCAIKNQENASGIVFYMQDTRNYYLLKGENENNPDSRIRLVKIINGHEIDLAQKQTGFIKGRWNKVSVAVLDSTITCFLNNKKLFSVTDTTYKEGRTGFWTNSGTAFNAFDDIIVEPSEKFFSACKNKTRFEYNFMPQLNAALDFSEWDVFSDRMLESPDNHTIYSKKALLRDLYMENREMFNRNFKITHVKQIPHDIDEYIRVRPAKTNEAEIKCLVSHSKAVLMVNGIPVTEAELKQARGTTTLVHDQNRWKLFIDNNKVLEYPYEMLTDSVRVGIGYSGAGEGIISNTRVIIENLE